MDTNQPCLEQGALVGNGDKPSSVQDWLKPYSRFPTSQHQNNTKVPTVMSNWVETTGKKLTPQPPDPSLMTARQMMAYHGQRRAEAVRGGRPKYRVRSKKIGSHFTA